MIDTLRRWTWNATQVVWGIAVGWSGVAMLTGDGTLGLFATILAVGLIVAAIRRWRRYRSVSAS